MMCKSWNWASRQPKTWHHMKIAVHGYAGDHHKIMRLWSRYGEFVHSVDLQLPIREQLRGLNDAFKAATEGKNLASFSLRLGESLSSQKHCSLEVKLQNLLDLLRSSDLQKLCINMEIFPSHIHEMLGCLRPRSFAHLQELHLIVFIPGNGPSGYCGGQSGIKNLGLSNFIQLKVVAITWHHFYSELWDDLRVLPLEQLIIHHSWCIGSFMGQHRCHSNKERWEEFFQVNTKVKVTYVIKDRILGFFCGGLEGCKIHKLKMIGDRMVVNDFLGQYLKQFDHSSLESLVVGDVTFSELMKINYTVPSELRLDLFKGLNLKYLCLCGPTLSPERTVELVKRLKDLEVFLIPRACILHPLPSPSMFCTAMSDEEALDLEERISQEMGYKWKLLGDLGQPRYSAAFREESIDERLLTD